MAGQRQPIELIIAKGKKHLTKAEIEHRKKTEVKAPDDNVVAPDYLTKSQKCRFNEIAKDMKDIGIMTNLDCDVLARFIIASDLYQKFTKMLKSKEIQDDIFTLEKVSALQDRYFKQCQATSKELGLTISSRCRLVVPKKEEPEKESKWSKYTGGLSG